VQSILDVAVKYVDSIFQKVFKNIDNTNTILVEILSIILRMLQKQQLMKKPTQMRIVVVAEAEVEVVVPEEIVQKIIRKVDIDVRHGIPRNIEQDAIELCIHYLLW
jgi:hypothetical protein